jgi:hypothetical protein
MGKISEIILVKFVSVGRIEQMVGWKGKAFCKDENLVANGRFMI